MKKWWILLLSGLAMLLLCPLNASAAEYGAILLYDEGNVLTTKEYNDCVARLQRAANETGMNVGVVLGVQSRSDYTIESLAISTYDEVFGYKSDGVLYYMDLKGYEPYDYIVTSGMGQFYYTNASGNNRVDMIFDLLDDYLYPVGSEDVAGAVMAFGDEVEYFYGQGVPDGYYYYDDVEHLYYYLDEEGVVQTSKTKPRLDLFTFLFLTACGFSAGLIAALITFAAVHFRYKFKYSLSPTTYVNKKSVQYSQKYDHFVRTYTRKVHIDSGGGGGGHGGGHGGGFSSGGHGGGGHHR